ncbi:MULTISPECIES: response regulator [Spongiibacter]|uniref:response regulator n=1 Tax=Spongiibacter TaxID=630749 RepID=UPI00048B7E69|nr:MULTISPECIES: response regulator [Spongiibacter]MAY37583.1 response regulator [Spongiibacter sp.]MBO6751570.1 response regulator [Spongiibacter sp.]MBU70689.1 response regulator [Spongiibacter sp.]
MRILIVEDFATMRRVIRNLLQDLGYGNICEADDGMAALTLLHNQRVDLVITDLLMPTMGGMELLRAVRADRQLCSTPVLMVTADAKRERIIEAAHAGVNAYIVKPFTAAVLDSKIRQIFRRLNSQLETQD